MLHYHGHRTQDGCEVTRIEDGKEEPLPLRLDLCKRDPHGFSLPVENLGQTALGDDKLAPANLVLTNLAREE